MIKKMLAFVKNRDRELAVFVAVLMILAAVVWSSLAKEELYTEPPPDHQQKDTLTTKSGAYD